MKKKVLRFLDKTFISIWNVELKINIKSWSSLPDYVASGTSDQIWDFWNLLAHKLSKEITVFILSSLVDKFQKYM